MYLSLKRYNVFVKLSDLMLGAHDIREESFSSPECNAQLKQPECKECKCSNIYMLVYIYKTIYLLLLHHLVVKYSFYHCETLCFLPNHLFLSHESLYLPEIK